MSERAGVKRVHLVVEMGPEGQEQTHHVRVLLGDQLRAELEQNKRGLDAKAHPFHLLTLWAWAAMMRLKLYDGTSQEFQDDCLDVARPDEEPEDVDPTQQGQSTT